MKISYVNRIVATTNLMTEKKRYGFKKGYLIGFKIFVVPLKSLPITLTYKR